MRSAPISILAVTLPLCVSPGMAQGAGIQGHGAGPGTMMQRLDADRDGFITQAEHRTRVSELFRTMDANGDRQLTREESMAVHMGPGPVSGGAHQRMAERRAEADARKAEQFAQMDGDNDGTVTRDEFVANADRNFAAMDGDRDGRVSMGEFRAGHRPW